MSLVEEEKERRGRLPSYLQEDVPRTEYIYKPDAKIFNIPATSLAESMHLLSKEKRGNKYIPPPKHRGTLPKLNEKLDIKLRERALEIQRQSDAEGPRAVGLLKNVVYLSSLYTKKTKLKHSQSLGTLSETRPSLKHSQSLDTLSEARPTLKHSQSQPLDVLDETTSVSSMGDTKSSLRDFDSAREADMESLGGSSISSFQTTTSYYSTKSQRPSTRERRRRRRNMLPVLPGQKNQHRLKLKFELSLEKKIALADPEMVERVGRLEKEIKSTRNKGKFILANKRVPSNEEIEWQREEFLEKHYVRKENAQWKRHELLKAKETKIIEEALSKEARRRRRTEVVQAFNESFHLRRCIRGILCLIYADNLAKKAAQSSNHGPFKRYAESRRANELHHQIVSRYQKRRPILKTTSNDEARSRVLTETSSAFFISMWMVGKFRLRKRRNAADVLIQTFTEMKHSSQNFVKVIKRFKNQINLIHRNVSGYFTIQKARLEAMVLWWNRTEERIRNEILDDQMSRKRAKKAYETSNMAGNKYNIDMDIKLSEQMKRHLLLEHITEMRRQYRIAVTNSMRKKRDINSKQLQNLLNCNQRLKEFSEEIGKQQVLSKKKSFFSLFSKTTEEQMTRLVISGFVGVREQQLHRKKLVMNRREVHDTKSTKKLIRQTNIILQQRKR